MTDSFRKNKKHAIILHILYNTHAIQIQYRRGENQKMQTRSVLIPVFIKACFDVDNNILKGVDMSVNGSYTGNYDAMSTNTIDGQDLSSLLISWLVKTNRSEHLKESLLNLLLSTSSFAAVTMLIARLLGHGSDTLYWIAGGIILAVAAIYFGKKYLEYNGLVSPIMKRWSRALTSNLMLDIARSRSDDTWPKDLFQTKAWLAGDRRTVKIAPFYGQIAKVAKLNLKSIVPKDGILNFISVIELKGMTGYGDPKGDCTCIVLDSDADLSQISGLIRNPDKNRQSLIREFDEFNGLNSIEECDLITVKDELN